MKIQFINPYYQKVMDYIASEMFANFNDSKIPNASNTCDISNDDMHDTVGNNNTHENTTKINSNKIITFTTKKSSSTKKTNTARNKKIIVNKTGQATVNTN